MAASPAFPVPDLTRCIRTRIDPLFEPPTTTTLACLLITFVTSLQNLPYSEPNASVYSKDGLVYRIAK
jgi:hypothetical protein